MTQEEARRALEQAGLKIGNVTTDDSDAEHKDLVLSSDPAAQTQVELGTSVSIVIGSGQASSLPVPDVHGITQEQTRDTLVEFTRVVFQYHDTQNPNENGINETLRAIALRSPSTSHLDRRG